MGKLIESERTVVWSDNCQFPCYLLICLLGSTYWNSSLRRDEIITKHIVIIWVYSGKGYSAYFRKFQLWKSGL